MFYDVDILNRRRGKFGVIWLAANSKLRLKGKGSRNDLRLVLSVNVDRMCQELMQYIKIENPPRFPEEFRPNSSFSLFLTAKLVHGIIVIHHKQVTNTLASVLLEVEQKTVRKRLKAANISCDVLDPADALIGVGNYLIHDKCTLEDREFGRLAEVVDALKITQISPRQTQRVTVPLVDWLIDEPVPDYNNADIYALEKDITMKELLVPMIVVNSPEVDDTFDDGEANIFENSQWGKVFDEPDVPRPSSLQRKNSKRLHGDEINASEGVPRKQSRPEIVGDADDFTQRLPFLDMVLEPVQYLPAVPRRGRCRYPRLIIDKEMVIPAESFREQLHHYEDLTRKKSDGQIIEQFQDCTVDHLFLRPSVEQYQSSKKIKELSTKNFKTLLTDFSTFDIVEDTRNHLKYPTMDSGSLIESHTFAPIPSPSNTLTATNLVTTNINVASLAVPTASAFGNSVGTLQDSLEKQRDPISREVSLVRSAHCSYIPGAEKSSRLSPQINKLNHILPTVAEVNPEVSSKSKFSQLPNNEKVSLAHVSTSSQRECSYPQVIVPVSQDLLNMVEETIEDMPSLTFRKLVPPTKYSKLEASKIFQNLLGLTNDRRIDMNQQTPYADIVITLNR